MPTLLILLNELKWTEALGWLMLPVILVLVPSAAAVVYFERREQPLYQRANRQRVYALGVVCVVLCLAAARLLEAPRPLMACLLALLIWALLQGVVNRVVTKASIHAAIAAGCSVFLVMAGKVNLVSTILLVGLLIAILWARIATQNHTVTQVVLGALIGALSALTGLLLI